MKRISVLVVFAVCFMLISASANALLRPAALQMCSDARYACVKVGKGQTWQNLFPDPAVRNVVMRLNRMNTHVYPGLIIVVPKDSKQTLMDIAPFYTTIAPPGEKTLIFDPVLLAWAAYSAEGKLVNWGPASGGKKYCPDLGQACATISGTFRMYNKGGPGCVSSKFPIPEGGAPMPYCMFFHGGFAFHASPQVPGFAASHGCVRIFYEDAQWLNQEFIDTGDEGTRVIIRRNSPASVGT